MKTAVDLPDDLAREIKLRAVSQGKKLKDMYAVLLRKGLDAPDEERRLEKPVIGINPATGLPAIMNGHPASPGKEMTPERIKEILFDDDLERYGAPTRR